MTKEPCNLLWIIGERGLLGSALMKRYPSHHPHFTLWQPLRPPFEWERPEILKTQFATQIELFKNKTAQFEGWTILWAAGAGVIGSSESALKGETKNFSFFLETLKNLDSSFLEKGTFCLASSAGGIWAGSQTFPCNESSPECPISEYGRQKLEQEQLLKSLNKQNPNLKVLLARISNLYGPGQKLSKSQGLLSQLCRSILLKVPLNIFVPLETVRDYIFSEDCAELMLRAIKKIQLSKSIMAPSVKIFASEDPISISDILGLLHRLTGREPLVSYPNQIFSNLQPKTLSFRSEVLIESYQFKPLVEGLSELLDYQESQLQLGELPFPEAV